MGYREILTELANYLNAVGRVYEAFYNKFYNGMGVDISGDNPRMREFLQNLSEIAREIFKALPVHPVAFQPKERVTMLFLFDNSKPFFQDDVLTSVEVYTFMDVTFKPNTLYFYEIVPEPLYTSYIAFRNARGKDIVRVPVIPKYESTTDIFNFALVYPVYRKVFRPEHLKPYERLFRLLFGDIRWDTER